MGLGKFISGIVTGVSIASGIVGQSPQAERDLGDQLSDNYSSSFEAKINSYSDKLKTATDASNQTTSSGGNGKG
jgi:hypothetical protein